MNIYKVERTDTVGYDEFDSFIIIAPSLDIARETNPRGEPVDNGSFSSWVSRKDIDSLEITRIGVADEDQQPGIVLASYNAG